MHINQLKTVPYGHMLLIDVDDSIVPMLFIFIHDPWNREVSIKNGRTYVTVDSIWHEEY